MGASRDTNINVDYIDIENKADTLSDNSELFEQNELIP